MSLQTVAEKDQSSVEPTTLMMKTSSCASLWMNVSSDPVVGNEQPSKSYYQRIVDDFHKNKEFESNRSTKSLKIRIAAIIKDCMKFQSCYEKIERRHPSGVPYQEHVMEAQARYSRASKEISANFFTAV
jgi:hypothetical protein